MEEFFLAIQKHPGLTLGLVAMILVIVDQLTSITITIKHEGPKKE